MVVATGLMVAGIGYQDRINKYDLCRKYMV